MKRETEQRRFSREYKLAAVSRMAAGENVSALSRELGVARKCLYQWRDRLRIGGPVALRSRGRPTRAEVLEMRAGAASKPEPLPPATKRPSSPPPPREPPGELARAREQIAELERKIGQQELELDFFQQALRHVRTARHPSGAPGGTTSTRSSKG